MNVVKDYLHSLEEDLRDRRMLPFVALVGVAMLAAIAFVILGGSGSGGSSSSTPSAAVSVSPAAGEVRGLSLTTTNTSAAVAETTSGTADQHHGVSRDPFALLPSAIAAEHAVSNTSGSGSSGGSSGSEPSGGSSGASEPSPEGSSKSGGSGNSGGSGKSGGSKPAKPKKLYQVSVLFGEITGSTPSENGLKPYENLALLTPLPSKAEPLVVFRGVTNGGKTATFTVASETILSGPGKCLPSALECQAIQLKAGQNEQLQYLPAGSQSVQSYELRLVSITPTSASAASLASLLSHQSKAGLEVLRRANLIAIPGLGASALAGVLVPTS